MKEPSWIWMPELDRDVNQYAEFRREFTIADDASALADDCRDQAAATTRAAHARFWKESAQAYETFAGEQSVEHFPELTQALALLCGVPDEQRALKLRSRLSRPDNGWVPTTLGQSIYKFEVTPVFDMIPSVEGQVPTMEKPCA